VDEPASLRDDGTLVTSIRPFEADIAPPRSSVSIYRLTIFAIIAAGIVRWVFDPYIGNGNFFFSFLSAVVFAAWIGGWRPAVLSSICGLLIAWFFFVPPRLTFLGASKAHLIGIAIYLSICAIFTVFGEAMRRAKELAKVQAELLRITLSSIGDAVIATDAGGRVTFLNEIAQKLTGWTQDLALGRGLDEVFIIVNEGTREPVENPALRAIREKAIVGLANHTILIARDGVEWPIEDSAAPIHDAQHRLQGAVLVFRDIVKRRNAEREERQAAARSRMILESITDAFFAVDDSWRFACVNRYAGRLLGRSPGDLLGKVLRDECPGLAGSEFERTYRCVKDERISAEVLAFYPFQNRWYHVHVYPSDSGISINSTRIPFDWRKHFRTC
jgi:PAS domain S-box-containing protein